MKNTFLTLLTGSVLLSSVILTGCGGVAKNDNTTAKKPQNTLRVTRDTGGIQETDWTWYVDIQSQYSASNFSLDVNFAQGIPSEVVHLQYFLDTDNNAATGFSYGEGSYEISGADYLIEDGDLYKSNSKNSWDWSYVGKFSQYLKRHKDDGKVNIQIATQESLITSIVKAKQINISIEPFDANWDGTYSTISTQGVKLAIQDAPVVQPPVVQPPVVQPPVVQPPVVQPPVIQKNETIYEDAENGLAGWVTTKGDNVAIRKTPGYKNQSQAFVKLPNKWYKDENGKWQNNAEYQLSLGSDTEHTILSVDLVGDGTEVEHYVLGVKVTTQAGERYLFWDSFYNHENIPATRTPYGDGNAYIVFPSPVEMVRGYDFSDVYLSENFTVDLKASLKQFEPQNEILSVDTFIATGGQLDNIKLLSK